MKVRTDFVSNSSSCSFVFKNRNSFIDDLKSLNYLLCHIDCIIFSWDLWDDAKEAYHQMMSNPLIQELQEKNAYSTIEYGDDPDSIKCRADIFEIKQISDLIISAASTCDTVEFFVMDNFDERGTIIVQLATILDYKHYEFSGDYEHSAYVPLSTLSNNSIIKADKLGYSVT